MLQIYVNVIVNVCPGVDFSTPRNRQNFTRDTFFQRLNILALAHPLTEVLRQWHYIF